MFDDLEDAPDTKDGQGWAGTIYGFCPVQGHGKLDDVYWYFRARWDDWTFDVYSAPCDDELPDQDKFLGYFDGSYANASWMKYSDAWRIIEDQITAWRSRADKESGR